MEDKLYLDKYQLGIIINALMLFRNELIEKGEDITPINELILKALDINKKRFSCRGIR